MVIFSVIPLLSYWGLLFKTPHKNQKQRLFCGFLSNQFFNTFTTLNQQLIAEQQYFLKRYFVPQPIFINEGAILSKNQRKRYQLSTDKDCLGPKNPK